MHIKPQLVKQQIVKAKKDSTLNSALVFFTKLRPIERMSEVVKNEAGNLLLRGLNEGKNMAEKLSSQEVFRQNLFSKLQELSFSNFNTRSLVSDASREDKWFLDLESQELIFKLKSNIDLLADTSSRLEFMMGEISHLVKKNI